MDNPKTSAQTAYELTVDQNGLLTPQIARTMEHLLSEKSLTANDLLVGLSTEREKLFKEQYGDVAAS